MLRRLNGPAPSRAGSCSTLLAAVPEAEVVVLDEVSHIFPIEDPEVLVEILDTYLGGR